MDLHETKGGVHINGEELVNANPDIILLVVITETPYMRKLCLENTVILLLPSRTTEYM